MKANRFAASVVIKVVQLSKIDRWLIKSERKRIEYLQNYPLGGQPFSSLPVRPRPFVDETISSWLVRLIVANGLTPAAFATEVLNLPTLRVLGIIDSVEKPGVIGTLEGLTGISAADLRECSFYDVSWDIPGIVSQDGSLLFGEMRFHPIQNHDPGLRVSGAFRACRECWREDSVPYIRKSWRQSFTTVCPKHKLVLSPCCKQCGKRFNASFATILSRTKYFMESLCICRNCGADVRHQSLYSVEDYVSPNPEWTTERLREAIDHADLDNHVVLEALFERCFLQGWFSLDDATKLSEIIGSRFAAWDIRLHTNLYPDIETAYLRWPPDWYENQVSKWMQREFRKVGTTASESSLLLDCSFDQPFKARL
ncbi:TniQ family protein [Duganella sp. HH101]|uniref:TniQ family protein n=1 Tax=Duganella sp. HH101 TaxID=1781066 RepID=UPI000893401B|nr:TniQ family protein [Duganella sp. HH101]OFA05659.1 hypothetical protein DUGA2_12380 [Duganella sp. HH101]